MGRPKKKHPGGRPPVIDENVLRQLDAAFALGCTDEEACLYANISPRALYTYQENNEEFKQRKEQLKRQPVLLAKTTVVEALTDDKGVAQWYLERRSPEFNPKQQIDLTSKGEKIDYSDPKIAALVGKFEAELKDEIKPS